MSRIVVCDIETNAIELEDINRIHVVGYQFLDEDEVKTITDPVRMKSFFQQGYTIIGHNFIKYDADAIYKILGVRVPVEQIIDTLGISWYLLPKAMRHGLAEHGERLGIPKPVVEDWENQDIEVYKNRVSEDVRINMLLWKEQHSYLMELYDNDEDSVKRVIEYLNFKLYQVHIQEEEKVKIDINRCKENLAYLEGIIEEKVKALEAVMPPVPIIKKKTKPKRYVNKDGGFTKLGEAWNELLKERGIPETYEGIVECHDGDLPPSAGSPNQIKKWLFSIGWKPMNFEDGAKGKVPQIRDKEKNLCPSILSLKEEHPEVEHLEGLSIATHRTTYLKAFIECADERGYITASASGYTKTLRLKHVKPFVNLVKPDKPYGGLIRSCIVAPPGKIIVGSDIASLEDQMKKIHIYSYDKEYVESMDTAGWDAHLYLGELCGMISKEETLFYKWWDSSDKDVNNPPEGVEKLSEKEYKEKFKSIKGRRSICKTGNYALVYGCGVPKLMEATRLPRKEASKLYEAYWKMNKSVRQFSEDRVVKTIGEHTWVWNETAKMWGYLTADKDRFSRCNSMGGVKVFDTWLYFMIKAGIRPCFSCHDEMAVYCHPNEYESVKKTLKDAMKKVNKAFGFPIEIEVDVKSGLNYSETH